MLSMYLTKSYWDWGGYMHGVPCQGKVVAREEGATERIGEG